MGDLSQPERGPLHRGMLCDSVSRILVTPREPRGLPPTPSDICPYPVRLGETCSRFKATPVDPALLCYQRDHPDFHLPPHCVRLLSQHPHLSTFTICYYLDTPLTIVSYYQLTARISNPTMNRLSGIPLANLSFHPIDGVDTELMVTPLHPPEDEICRYHEPSGRSIHLRPDMTTNSIVMTISPSHPPGGAQWRIYVYVDLWFSGALQRTAQGVEPVFNPYPSAWGSDSHCALVNRWASDNGVNAAVLPSDNHCLYVWNRT